MVKRREREASFLFLVLAGLFITSLVSCNLIFLKFFEVELPLVNYRFQQSVGLLPYPFTFLITDIISEVYGKKKANQVVMAGLISALFMIFLVFLARMVPAMPNSPVDDATFEQVFGLAYIGVLASLVAYLFAQYIDVQVFHFIKRKTKGKHLWLRNNVSTFSSQILDTFIVVYILYSFGKLPSFETYFYNGISYKLLFALLDTPLAYLFLYFIRKYFGLKFGEEFD